MPTAAPLPPDHGRGPRQPGPKRAKHDQRSVPDTPRTHRFIQRDGNRRGRRIAIPVEIEHHFFCWKTEAFHDRRENPEIGLVGHI